MKTLSEFLPIPGFTKYLINREGVVITQSGPRTDSIGRCYNFKSRIISNRIDPRSGYLQLMITKDNGGRGHQYLHKLLAITFLTKPEGKDRINHIDGNKLNNSLENLEWVTARENYQYARQLGLILPPHQNRVRVHNCCTGEIAESIMEASKHSGETYRKFISMLKGLCPNNTCWRIYPQVKIAA